MVKGLYEREFLFCVCSLADKLEFRSKVALDVGANIGNHSLFMSRYFDSVIAFEPCSYLNMVLRANVLRNKINNVEVSSYGLGDSKGVAGVVEQASDNIGMVELKRFGGGISNDTERVQVEKGDELLFDRYEKIGFIKIDAEGMEVSVIQGLQKCILRDRPLIAFESRRAKEGGDVISVLQKLGYFNYYEVSASRIGLRDIFESGLVAIFRKKYVLQRLGELQDSHYPSIFATCDELDV
nr:FkbM family methyltransferase [Gilvimarinus xylanilyticus]